MSKIKRVIELAQQSGLLFWNFASRVQSERLEAFYKAAYNDGLEAAIKACHNTHDDHVLKGKARATSYDCADAIETLQEPL